MEPIADRGHPFVAEQSSGAACSHQALFIDTIDGCLARCGKFRLELAHANRVSFALANSLACQPFQVHA